MSTVDVEITNPTDVAVQAKLVGTRPKQPPIDVQLGTVAPGGTITHSQKWHDSTTLMLEGSATSRNIPPQSWTITGEPNPRTINAEFYFESNVEALPVDNKAAIDKINAKFRDLGENRGFSPLTVDAALKSHFGALLVVVPPDDQHPHARVLFQLTPAQFSGDVKPNITYPNNRDEVSEVVTGDALAGVSAAVAGYSLTATGDGSRAFKFAATLAGFGEVTREEAADWNYAKGLAKLSPETRAALVAAATTPGAQIIYINRMYVIQSARYELSEGTAYHNENDIKIVWFSGSAKWHFQSSTSKIQDITGAALNFDGVVLQLVTPTPPDRRCRGKDCVTDLTPTIEVEPNERQSITLIATDESVALDGELAAQIAD